MLARRGDANGPERAGAARGDRYPSWYARWKTIQTGPPSASSECRHQSTTDPDPASVGGLRPPDPRRSHPRRRSRLVITKISDFRTTAATGANEVSEARSRRRMRGERSEAVPEVSASGANQGSRSPRGSREQSSLVIPEIFDFRRQRSEQDRLSVGRAPGGFRRAWFLRW